MADTNPLRDAFTVIVADELARLGMDMPVTARVIAARLDAAVGQFIGDGLLDKHGQRWTARRLGSNIVAPIVRLERSGDDQEGR